VKLEVYNLQGQLVARLVDHDMAAGRHEVQWDGRDDAGTRVASGIYYLRLESGQLRATRKVVKLE